MNTFLIIILAVLNLIFVSVTLFLLNEMRKKFGFMRQFVQTNRGRVLTFIHEGARKPGMYNIVLSGNAPFTVLIGFDLYLFGRVYYDYYGFLDSGDEHMIVFSTYLGKKGATFKFLTNCDVGPNNLSVSSSVIDQNIRPHAVFKPHWWQTWLGI